jgi:hypothetical protein
MTTEERQLLYDKIMERAPLELCVEMSSATHKMLDDLEPIIDGILDRARDRAVGYTEQAVVDPSTLGLNVLPDGAEHVIVDGAIGGAPRSYRFTLQMERCWLRNLASFLIVESFRQ